jgi:hypothetical protein
MRAGIPPGCDGLVDGLHDTAGTGHLNHGFDGIFETVRVVSRGFVSIAEVHSIGARAHLAQSEPEVARDRFGFLERHGFAQSSSGYTHKAADTASFAVHFLVALAPAWDLLFRANYLFVAAKIAWHEAPPSKRRARD